MRACVQCVAPAGANLVDADKARLNLKAAEISVRILTVPHVDGIAGNHFIAVSQMAARRAEGCG